MAYTNKVGNNYNDVFPVRLRAIMELHNCAPKDLATSIGISAQAVGAYCRGETMPKLEFAQAIADHFDISLDYLSGRTEISSRDDNFHIAHNVTGLSEKAIERLGSIEDPYGIINSMLESEQFCKIVDNIAKSIAVQESQTVKFAREITADLVKAMGATGTIDLTSGFSNSHNYDNFDEYISMLSMLAPNRVALPRMDAVKFYLQEAQNDFKCMIDEIAK